jgi:hypothetical protein
MAQRTSPDMTVAEFEQIAAFAERQIETVRLEFVDGRLGVRKSRTATTAPSSCGWSAPTRTSATGM